MPQTAIQSHRARCRISKNSPYLRGLARVDKEEHKASGSGSGWPAPVQPAVHFCHPGSPDVHYGPIRPLTDQLRLEPKRLTNESSPAAASAVFARPAAASVW